LKAEPTVPLEVSALVMTGVPPVAIANTRITLELMPLELLAQIKAPDVPAAVGVPEITPVAESAVKPGGKVTPVPKLVGLFVAVMMYVKGIPTVPLAVKGLVTTGTPGKTDKTSVDGALVPLPLVAANVTLNVPAEVGVPEIMPVSVSTDNPVGNPIALKLVGLPLAVMA